MTVPPVKNEKDVLVAVARIADELALKVFVVGAGARDLLLEQANGVSMRPRRTLDIDVAVSVRDWEEYHYLFQKLQDTYGCKADSKFKGRLRFPGAPSLDVVPFGAIADEKGNIRWPPEYAVEMGVAGFGAVLDAAVDVEVGGCRVKVAPFPCIVLLKWLAWNDRNDRTDDLRDIWFVFEHYSDLTNPERLYSGQDSDIIDEDDFDWVVAGARLTGRDIIRQTGPVGKDLLIWLDPENPHLQETLINGLSPLVSHTEQHIIDTLRGFRNGLDENAPHE